MYNLQFKLENTNKVFDHLEEIKNYLKLPKEVTVFDYAKEHDLKIYYRYTHKLITNTGKCFTIIKLILECDKLHHTSSLDL